MAQIAAPSLLAAATGILGSAWASGSIASFTLFGVPTALALPSQQAQIWHQLYLRGMGTMPKVAITVGLAYAYAAYDTASRRGKWQGFAAGAVLMVGIVPFTLTMRSTNETIINLAKGAATMSHGQVSDLLKKWATMNAIRALLPLAGAIVGSLTLWNNIA
ncbi:Monooxygenase hypC [Paramyrothecium foliicola]|nr:Monooxygenase hypC [Paramyrothecium foliicola]